MWSAAHLDRHVHQPEGDRTRPNGSHVREYALIVQSGTVTAKFHAIFDRDVSARDLCDRQATLKAWVRRRAIATLDQRRQGALSPPPGSQSPISSTTTPVLPKSCSATSCFFGDAQRWPNGVDQPCLRKQLCCRRQPWLSRNGGAPVRRPIRSSIDSATGLAWIAQQAAPEVHVPQWWFVAEPGSG